jgi:PAS domain S-box-containing protein
MARYKAPLGANTENWINRSSTSTSSASTVGNGSENDSDLVLPGLNQSEDNSPDVVFRLDGNLRYVYISSAVEQHLGMWPENFLGKTVLDLRSAVYNPEPLATKCREAIQSGTSVQTEFHVGTKDYRTRLVPEYADDGTVKSLLGITDDITVRKQTETALRRTQDQYYSLIQSIDGIVWELDYETRRFTFVSKQAERLLGYPVTRWLDEPSFWTDHLHHEDRDRTIEKYRSLGERSEHHEFEYRMIRADGQIAWLRDIVTVEQRDGQTFRLRGVMIDITALKEEEALRIGQSRVLEMIATGASIVAILEEIALLIESHSPDTRCGVLLLCEYGIHVSRAVAPHLPDSYKVAVKGRAIGPSEGSCGAAMYHKTRVVVRDVRTDPLWENYRDLALANGVKACWSTPILTGRGKVLGAFGMHCSESRAPSVAEERLADFATRLAGIAIERELAEESLRQSEERYRALVTASAQDVWRTDQRGETFFVTSTWEKMNAHDTTVLSDVPHFAAIQPRCCNRTSEA